MLECGMAELVDEQFIPTTVEGRKLLSGVFAVPHKPTADRFIFDRRVLNATEARLKWCSLPHGTQLTQVALGPSEQIRGTVRDLSHGPGGFGA